MVPGFVNTPERFAKWECELAKRQLPDEEAGKMREQWSLNQASRNTRWGNPEELANLIVFALSEAASFVNGAVLGGRQRDGQVLRPAVRAPTGETGYPMKRFLDAP